LKSSNNYKIELSEARNSKLIAELKAQHKQEYASIELKLT